MVTMTQSPHQRMLTDRDIVPQQPLDSISIEDEEPLSFNFQRHDGLQGTILVTLDAPRPVWLVPVVQQLARILELRPNWNSYGAQPVEIDAVSQAYIVLVDLAKPNTLPPAVLPTPHKGIQLEWHTKEIDLEIEVSPDGKIYVLLEDIKHHREWEGELSDNLPGIQDAINQLSI